MNNRDLAHKLKATYMALEKLGREREVWEAQRNVLDQDLRLIQSACPHLLYRVPDASGGNDSYDRCGVCGAEDR